MITNPSILYPLLPLQPSYAALLTMCGLKATGLWICHLGGSGTSECHSCPQVPQNPGEAPWRCLSQTGGTWHGQPGQKNAGLSKTTESKQKRYLGLSTKVWAAWLWYWPLAEPGANPFLRLPNLTRAGQSPNLSSNSTFWPLSVE